MTGSNTFQSQIADTLGLTSTIFGSYTVPIVIVCGILFFVLCVGLLMKLMGKDMDQDFAAPEEEIFSEDI